jgi:IS5 family transposase
MLKALPLQRWYSLSDEDLEEALSDNRLREGSVPVRRRRGW